jgi:hypothetical protein
MTVQHPNRLKMHTYIISRRAIDVTVDRLLKELEELEAGRCPLCGGVADGCCDLADTIRAEARKAVANLPGPTCPLCGGIVVQGCCDGCLDRDQT